MTAREFHEWAALFKIENEEEKQRDIERRAADGLSDMRRRGFRGWKPG